MERIGAASDAIADHTPRLSKIWREPLPSAVVRSSKLGCAAESGGTLSMSRVRSFVSRKASAKLAPTMPPPTMATSVSRTGFHGRAHHATDAMSRSMATASLGTPSVSTSQPSRVTTTSSSMRMPMPWYFFGAPGVPGAT